MPMPIMRNAMQSSTFADFPLSAVQKAPQKSYQIHLYLYIISFGLMIAIFAVLRSILILKFMGMEQFNNAFGLMLLFMGVTVFIGNPFRGGLKDVTGRYDYSFYVAGAYFLVSGIMCYPVQWVRNWEDENLRKKEQQEDTKTDLEMM